MSPVKRTEKTCLRPGIISLIRRAGSNIRQWWDSGSSSHVGPRPTWDSGQERMPNSSSSEATVLIFASVFPISAASHLQSSFLSLQLGAEGSRRQIQGTDKQTDSCSGLFSMVAGSHSSLSSRSLRLLVSDFTSSGQLVKLAALVLVPSLPFVVALTVPLWYFTLTSPFVRSF